MRFFNVFNEGNLKSTGGFKELLDINSESSMSSPSSPNSFKSQLLALISVVPCRFVFLSLRNIFLF